MTLDVATRPDPSPIWIHPETGEEIDLRQLDSAAELFLYLDAHRASIERVREAARFWILQEMDTRKEWRLPDLNIQGDPPAASTLEWDQNTLRELRDHLAPERYQELVHETVVLQPDSRKLQAIAKQDPDSEVGRIIQRAEGRKPKPRRYVRAIKKQVVQ